MIKIKNMSWGNAFSYGDNNYIDFENTTLLQLVGKNGHGKSSISLLLEECLFNKNSKGIKKANILNRYSDANKYFITVEFSVNNDNYIVKTIRGTTQTVSLIKNDEDISAHTATSTYKLLENILGFDNKTFTQIVYQSNAFSLEFLTATDSNRKKFLIDLLSLEKYTNYCDTFKIKLKDATNKLEVVAMKQTTVSNWLKKFSSESLEEQELLEAPKDPDTSKLIDIDEKIGSINLTNKRITQNNKYKEILSTIDISPIPDPKVDIVWLSVVLKESQNKLLEIQNTIKGIGPIKTKCGTCGQPIDSSHKEKLLEGAKQQLPSIEALVRDDTNRLTRAKQLKVVFDKYVANQTEWERCSGFIDHSLPSTQLDIDDLNKEKMVITTEIDKALASIKNVNTKNAEITAHNAKVRVIREQLETMQRDSAEYAKEAESISKQVTNLQILVKAFGTSGLVAYKIECLVKDLEELTNEYLADMSDGRFQLNFSMSSSDKLDVVITDNGTDIDIYALSNGELARVNISTLLAIRKLMQTLSDTRINLLILDETISSLDLEGKEKLIEVLLKEEYLNTILVSHDFTHPLLEKLHIIKENNVSRIE